MSWTVSAFTDEAGTACAEQITAAKRAGLNFIDIRSIDGYNIVALPLEQAVTIKEQLDAAGLKVQMLGSPIGKIDIADPVDSDLDRLRHLGELAPALGCNAVRIFSYYNRDNRPHDEWQAESLNRLTTLRTLAAELGLVLYHENERHIFGDEADNVEAIAGLRDANFKLIFDFDNYNQGAQDVWQVWEQFRDRTDAFHLKDSLKTADGYAHVPGAGQGDGQIVRILSNAVALGWVGPIAVEPHLSHSGAVAATGPSGLANEAYSGMPAAESFHIAATVGFEVLTQVGASFT